MRLLNLDRHDFIARHLLTSEGVETLMRLSQLPGGVIMATPVRHETPATCWTNEDVALLRPGALTDFLMDDLDMLKQRGASIDDIQRYLLSSGLLCAKGQCALALTL